MSSSSYANDALNVSATVANHSVNAVRRYKDGYRVARFVNGMGTVVKVIGFLIGAVMALGGISTIISGITMNTPTQNVPFAQPNFPIYVVIAGIGIIIWALLTTAIWYIIGVLVSAIGQHLLASLDSAVHGSPFLTLQQKAEVMSI